MLMGFQYSNLMQFDSLTFQQNILIDGFHKLGTVFLSLVSENPRSRFMLEWCFYCVDFEFWNALLDLSFFACSMMVRTILLFFFGFFWRSGLPVLEYWMWLYVWGHWFGCSLLPGMLLSSSCQDVGFICPFMVIDPTNLEATTTVAWNLWINSFSLQKCTFSPHSIFSPLFLNEDGRVLKNGLSKLHYRFRRYSTVPKTVLLESQYLQSYDSIPDFLRPKFEEDY